MFFKMENLAQTFFSLFILLGADCASLKKGGAVGPKDYLCDDLKVMDGIHWWYDWGFSLNGIAHHSGCTNLDRYKSTFIPMVWGGKINKSAIAYKEAAYILGYNAPNHKGSSNLTPKQAAAHWPLVEKIGRGKKLVSPSASPCGTPASCYGNATQWFDEFFRLCKGCRVDYIATHSYRCQAQGTMDYLENIYNRYGKKIWLTEFACHGTNNPKKQLAYMKEILPRLEAAPYIFRYSWYVFRRQKPGYVKSAVSLLKQNSSELTELGKFYNSYNPDSTSEPYRFFSMAKKFIQRILMILKF